MPVLFARPLGRAAPSAWFLGTLVVACACTQGEETGLEAPFESGVVTPADAFIVNPFDVFPERFSQVGLYPRAPDLSMVAPEARYYIPSLELWSNGADKERFVVLPGAQTADQAQIDNSDRAGWQFPVGVLFFKTFSLPDASLPGDRRAIETRVIRRGAAGWEYAVYQWSADATDASQLELSRPVSVVVESLTGEAFEYEIPSRLECRQCHESDPRTIIGFDELRLNHALPGSMETQLETLQALGFFSAPIPDDPERIVSDDELTREVTGYIHGNCAHCHNGLHNASSAFDMRHPVFVANTVGRPTESSGSAPGIRVVPGHPEQSVLFEAVSGGGDIDFVAEMPPLGVQVRDDRAIELLRRWIEALPSDD